MFFIFGWNHTKIDDCGPVQEEKCQNCHNSELWHLKKVSRYFTLFFIPVFPHDSENVYHCPICNYGVKLSHEDYLTYKSIAETNTACLDKNITEDERLVKLDAIHKAKQERDETENKKAMEDSAKWTSLVAEKSNEELQTILNKKDNEYNPAFVIAVKKELDKRNA